VSIPFDLRSFGRVAGLVAKAEFKSPRKDVSEALIFTHAGNLEEAGEISSLLEIPLPDNVESGDSFQVKVLFRDFSDSQVETLSCTYIYDETLPQLNSINNFDFHPQRYVESSGSPSNEFRFKSKVPVRQVRLSYQDHEAALEEVYTPFERPGDEWLVIAPKPRLAGLQQLTIKAESESGAVTRHSVVMHFGERILLKEKLASVSSTPFENVIALGIQSGSVQFWDLLQKTMLASHPVPPHFQSVLISPQARYLILSYDDRLRIIDLMMGEQREVTGSIKQVQVTDDERILAGIRDSKLITVDLALGQILDEIKFESRKVTYVALSRAGQRVAFMNDDRKVFGRPCSRIKDNP
jgi:WD40 repeat protein